MIATARMFQGRELIDRPEHRRLFRLAENHAKEVAGVYHFITHDWYRLKGQNYTYHYAVVVMATGAYYVGKYRGSKTPYNRPIWRQRAIGMALKKASSNHGFNGYVDAELDPKNITYQLREELGI